MSKYSKIFFVNINPASSIINAGNASVTVTAPSSISGGIAKLNIEEVIVSFRAVDAVTGLILNENQIGLYINIDYPAGANVDFFKQAQPISTAGGEGRNLTLVCNSPYSVCVDWEINIPIFRAMPTPTCIFILNALMPNNINVQTYIHYRGSFEYV